MYFSSPLLAVLALAPSTIFALPTGLLVPSLSDVLGKRQLSKVTMAKLVDPICDLDGVTVPLDTGNGFPLPPVSEGLKLYHVAIGRGTQNYTCATSTAASTPAAVGAVATLFNATCAASRAPGTLASTPNIALNFAVPSGAQADALLAGHHFFTNPTTPRFDLDTSLHTFGAGNLKKTANTTAPADAPKDNNGNAPVPWLKLTKIEDGVFNEVYRVDTAGGAAPKTCEGQAASFTVEYSANYWFYKSPEAEE